jgi:nucleoside-diphosphate kinase
MIEKTFLMVKPDGVRRKLIGEILSRFELKGLEILAMRMLTLDEELASLLYAEHIGKDFFPPFKEFVMSGPVVVCALRGENAIQSVRAIVGATNPQEAMPGTIRGDYCTITRYNLVHASDKPETARRELSIFFKDLCEDSTEV